MISFSICMFRLITWQVIMITTVELSFGVVLVLFLMNARILFKLQTNMLTFEPLNSALQSLVLPVFRLPSVVVDENFALKVLLRLILAGNTLLMAILMLIFAFVKAEVFDPWAPGKEKRVIYLKREWFEVLCWTSLLLYLAATLPTFWIVIKKTDTVRQRLRFLISFNFVWNYIDRFQGSKRRPILE